MSCRLDLSLAGTKANMPMPFPSTFGRVLSSAGKLGKRIKRQFERKQTPHSPGQNQSPGMRPSRMPFGLDNEQSMDSQEETLPEPIQSQLYEAIAVSAMQFQGYLTSFHRGQVCTFLVLHSSQKDQVMAWNCYVLRAFEFALGAGGENIG